MPIRYSDKREERFSRGEGYMELLKIIGGAAVAFWLMGLIFKITSKLVKFLLTVGLIILIINVVLG